MKLPQLRISRRSITIAAALAGLVSLAIGAHAALNKRALDAAKAVAAEQSTDAARRGSKLALVIGNGHYPDASAPLTQPINDARALTASLRRNGFTLNVQEIPEGTGSGIIWDDQGHIVTNHHVIKDADDLLGPAV